MCAVYFWERYKQQRGAAAAAAVDRKFKLAHTQRQRETREREGERERERERERMVGEEKRHQMMQNLFGDQSEEEEEEVESEHESNRQPDYASVRCSLPNSFFNFTFSYSIHGFYAIICS